MSVKQQNEVQPDTCEVRRINPGAIGDALVAMPDDAVFFSLVETFKTLADPTRLRIVLALSERELCVCDLAEILGITGSAVSHQLRLLRGQKLVRYRKDGKIAYYTLDDDHICALVRQGIEHFSE